LVRRAFVSQVKSSSCNRRDTHLVPITHHVYTSKAALCQRAQKFPFRRNLYPWIPPTSLPATIIVLLYFVVMLVKDR
jgi:hypothetical protein